MQRFGVVRGRENRTALAFCGIPTDCTEGGRVNVSIAKGRVHDADCIERHHRNIVETLCTPSRPPPFNKLGVDKLHGGPRSIPTFSEYKKA